jgi:pimeloyl-ACP methyl ester carboxylesterase
MRTARSADGTKIAFDQTGEGPPVILVVGAFNTRSTGEPLARALESQFTVLNYDRRGRGESGDVQPYAVEREVEDLDALIREAGGAARVFGYSSGGILALEAAARGLNITKLALYDAPFMVGDERPRPSKDMAAQLAQLVTAGRRGEAVELFQTRVVGIPEEVVAEFRHAPFRPALEAIAHTLVYDATLVGDMTLPTAEMRSIKAPTLVVYGGDSPAFMGTAAKALARALADGRVRGLDGQNHDIVPAALAPLLMEFFRDDAGLDKR